MLDFSLPQSGYWKPLMMKATHSVFHGLGSGVEFRKIRKKSRLDERAGRLCITRSGYIVLIGLNSGFDPISGYHFGYRVPRQCGMG